MEQENRNIVAILFSEKSGISTCGRHKWKHPNKRDCTFEKKCLKISILRQPQLEKRKNTHTEKNGSKNSDGKQTEPKGNLFICIRQSNKCFKMVMSKHKIRLHKNWMIAPRQHPQMLKIDAIEKSIHTKVQGWWTTNIIIWLKKFWCLRQRKFQKSWKLVLSNFHLRLSSKKMISQLQNLIQRKVDVLIATKIDACTKAKSKNNED